MPWYRIHRIRGSQKEHFRWAAHTGGLAIVKQRDYEPGAEVESLSPYALWKQLQRSDAPQQEAPLTAGDVLEDVLTGQLFITKYIGFEPARWFVPEPAASADIPTEKALQG